MSYSLLQDADLFRGVPGIEVWAVAPHYLVGGISGRQEATEAIESRYCLGFTNRARLVSVSGRQPQRVGADVLRMHNVGEHLCSQDLHHGSHSGVWCVFAPTLAEDLAQNLGDAHAPFARNFFTPSPAELLRIRRFFKLLREGGDGPWVIEGMLAIAASLGKSTAQEDAKCTGRQLALARRADEWLAQGFAGPANLPEIARALDVSPSYLARAYRAATGRRLHQQIARMRVAAALARLSDGARDLASLAFDLGYSSHSHFSADFRRLTGKQPSSFRRGSEI